MSSTAHKNAYARLLLVGIALVMTGQAIRYIKTGDGTPMAPQFLRHHLTNLTDVLAIASYANMKMMQNEKLGEKSRPVWAGLAVYGAGAAFEAFQAVADNKPYDLIDLACYTASLFMFWAAASLIDRRFTTHNTLT